MVVAAVLSLVVGAILGLSLAAPPEPMNAVIAEVAVGQGWRTGFAAGLGAATADTCIYLLALAGLVTFLRGMETLQAAMVGVGGVILLYYANGAVRSAAEPFTGGGKGGGSAARSRSLSSTPTR